MKQPGIVFAAVLCVHATAHAADPARVVRVWGHPQTSALVARWSAALAGEPDAPRVESHLTGSDVAMGGLYTDKADVALLGREANAAELKAFEWVFRFKPTAIEIATGSEAASGKSPALVVFVHRDNPLARVTLVELDAIFGHERLRGGPRQLSSWDALDLDGEWSGKPINLYLHYTESGTGRFFRKAVLEDSRMLNWDRVRESGTGREILDALARDRFGLAVANLGAANRQVRALPLALDGATRAVAATRETVMTRSYPLRRVVFAYVRRAPGAPLDPSVAQLLRHALSARGQLAAERAGYLPLREDVLRTQLAALE